MYLFFLQGELELLMLDEEADNKKHFSLKSIMKESTKNKKSPQEPKQGQEFQVYTDTGTSSRQDDKDPSVQVTFSFLCKFSVKLCKPGHSLEYAYL